MIIKYYCPVWGMKHLPLTKVLAKIKTSGYDGAEIALDPDTMDIFAIKNLFEEHGLEMIAQLPYPKSGLFLSMLTDYVSKLQTLLTLNPILVNCHTGKDYFSIEDNLTFIKKADELSKQHHITVAHETHRGRFSFAPVLIPQYLQRFPNLNLTADFSHWCVVSESLLEDQQAIIDLIAPNCVLIHARVGYAQGAQVNNPESQEYQKELQQHTKWWQQILDCHKAMQKQELLITCEFGPPPYMHLLPNTKDPVDAQFDMNLFMKNYLTKNLI